MAVVIKRLPKLLEEVVEPVKIQMVEVLLAASEIPSEAQVSLPVMASYKYDGIRSAITTGVAMSRKMIPLPNLFIQGWVNTYAKYLNGVDGEFIVGPPNEELTFNTSTSGINRISGEPDFKFYVFERWDMEGVDALERYHQLRGWYSLLPEEIKKRVVLVEQRLIGTMEELKAFYAEALALGYEGLILKAPDLLYKYGRSTILEGYCLKWKEFDTSEAIIIEVKQGKTNTNAKVKDALGKAKRSSAKAGQVLTETVGGFVIRDVNPNSRYFGKVFSCGTGPLTDADCASLFLIKDLHPGRLITYRFQKSGAKNKPRYPAFKEWLMTQDHLGYEIKPDCN